MTRLMRQAAAALALGLAGCGDGFTPTEETVVGTYEAEEFEVSSGGFTTDLLALGATVTVTLSPDGTTSGRLFVPGAGEGGSDVDESLTGTWSLSGSTVTFSQSADTFIPDVEFTAGENVLTGEGTFEEDTVRLRLRKTASS